MAAIVLDLSRRGDQGNPLLEIGAAVDRALADWIAAANAQNPAQLLTLQTNSQQAPGFWGWTVQARINVLQAGQPVQLMGQWVYDLATTRARNHVGSATGHDPAGGQGGHGLLSGGRGSEQGPFDLQKPDPFAAVAAWSLAAGNEFFVFAFSRHIWTTAQSLPLLIAKDTHTDHWHLAAGPMGGAAVPAAGWSSSGQRVALADGHFAEGWSARTMLTQPVQWNLLPPPLWFPNPAPPVQWIEPMLLPDGLAIHSRSATTALAYSRAVDGSEWLGLGPTGLVVRTVDPTS